MIRKFDPSRDVVLTCQQVRDFDKWAINVAGVPGVVLMENAGRSCAEIILEELKNFKHKSVCIFCGTGNNGGDGFVIARHLFNNSIDTKIILCGPKAKIKGDAEINYRIACNMNIPVLELDISLPDIEEKICRSTRDSNLIVDAIFGTGLSGRLEGNFVKIIEAINSLNKPVVAVDIPSGLECDTGLICGAAIKAKITVTFAAAKKGFLNPDAIQYTGQIYIASIGIEPAQTQLLRLRASG